MNKIDSVDSFHSVEKSSHRWTQIYTLITHYWAEAVVVALAKRYVRPLFAVTAVAFTLLQPNTIWLSDLLHTEIPFVFISVLFVLVAVDGPFSSSPWLREVASFVLASAGFLLRTAGVALLAAWVLEALVRRHWRLALVRGFLAILPIIAWQTYVVRVTRSYEYAHPAYAYQRAAYQYWNVSYVESIGLIDPSYPGWRNM